MDLLAHDAPAAVARLRADMVRTIEAAIAVLQILDGAPAEPPKVRAQRASKGGPVPARRASRAAAQPPQHDDAVKASRRTRAPDGASGGGQAKPAPAAAASRADVTYNDVTVRFSPGVESIEHGDKLVRVNARQALFVSLIARTMPVPCDRGFIARALWSGQRVPDSSEQILTTLAGELRPRLAEVGLDIKTVRGSGFALAPAAPPSPPVRDGSAEHRAGAEA